MDYARHFPIEFNQIFDWKKFVQRLPTTELHALQPKHFEVRLQSQPYTIRVLLSAMVVLHSE
jgi:hypothetical protein